MPTQIIISSVSGSSPFDVYTCDTGYTNCVYINTITSLQIPFTFLLPPMMEGMYSVGIKLIDNNDCIIQENLII